MGLRLSQSYLAVLFWRRSMESENCQCLNWQLVSESVADGTSLSPPPFLVSLFDGAIKVAKRTSERHNKK